MKTKKFLWMILTVILLLSIGGVLFCFQSQENSSLPDEQALEEPKDKVVELTVYKKIKNKQSINVLVIGDSIGANSGASEHSSRWDVKFRNLFTEEFDIPVNLTNISVPGTDSMFGIVKLNQEIDLNDFDLVIVCFGQNDNEDFIDVYYEALIRTIRTNNDEIEIVPILESAQKEYTPKMNSIKNIAVGYNLPVADVIAAYNNSGISYDDLTIDGIHPNDVGYELYAREVLNAIKVKMEKDTTGVMLASPRSSDCEAFSNYTFVSMDELEKLDYLLSVDATGIGLYYFLSPNGGKYTVTLNDDRVYERENTAQYSDKESCEILYWDNTMQKMDLKLTLEENTNPDSFIGVFYFSK